MVGKRQEALRRGERLVTVNDLAGGSWSRKVGKELVFVCDGQNPMHRIVRHKGARRTFGFPTRWLDEEGV